MPQISLYIDEATLRKVERAASRQQVSISKWVADQIRSKIEPVYPKGYEDLYGAISDETFERPTQPSLSGDNPRESF